MADVPWGKEVTEKYPSLKKWAIAGYSEVSTPLTALYINGAIADEHSGREVERRRSSSMLNNGQTSPRYRATLKSFSKPWMSLPANRTS